MLLLMTSLGVPCVYYGDEVGMTGGDDPDCRRTMVWDESERDTELRQFFSDLISCRRDTRALRRGTIRFDEEQCDGDVVVFRRKSGDSDESVTVAVNRGDDPAEIRLSAESGKGHEVCFETTTDEIEQVGDGRFTLPAMSGVVWQ
jgi:glycosidase